MIGVIVLVFGYNIEKKIHDTLGGNTIKNKWLELMRVDKEVDSTIGGIIDDKIAEALSDTGVEEIEMLKQRLSKIEKRTITFTDNDTEEE